MEKIKVKPIRTRQTEEYRVEVANDYIKRESVRNFLTKNQLGTDYLMDNLSLFIRLEEENEACKNCPGYKNCTKQPRGFVTEIDPYLDEICYTPCKYRLDFEKIMDGYIRKDFYDEWLNIDLINDIKVNTYRKRLITMLLSISLGKTNKGVYVHSDGESGKSVILAAFCNHLIAEHNKKVAFVNVSDFLQDLKSKFNVANSNIDEIIESLQKVEVLVLDDIGGETFSAWSINDVLYKIIDYRNRSGLLTCYSSIYSLEDLQKEYLKKSSKATRLIQKIQAYTSEVELKGVSVL